MVHDMLKIANADRFIKERVSEYGEVIVLLWNTQKRKYYKTTNNESA